MAAQLTFYWRFTRVLKYKLHFPFYSIATVTRDTVNWTQKDEIILSEVVY